MISHLSLTKVDTLSNAVSLQVDSNGFEFLIIEHNKLSAALTLHGAHLIHFQKKGEQPLIWLSKTAKFNEKTAIRGGVPICWPWFGDADGKSNEKLPGHGFARINRWQLTNIEESDQGVVLELQLKSSEETLKLWPFQFELTLKVTLHKQLTLELITKNSGDKAFAYRGALHTYFNISAPEVIEVSGLNRYFYNSLKQKQRETGDTTLLIDQAIDSIYEKSASNIQLNDKQFQKKLTISNSGNDSEVIWTPWVEGAKALSDMPDNGYQSMLCIESAITQGEGEKVAAGKTHSLSTSIC